LEASDIEVRQHTSALEASNAQTGRRINAIEAPNTDTADVNQRLQNLETVTAEHARLASHLEARIQTAETSTEWVKRVCEETIQCHSATPSSSDGNPRTPCADDVCVDKVSAHDKMADDVCTSASFSPTTSTPEIDVSSLPFDVIINSGAQGTALTPSQPTPRGGASSSAPARARASRKKKMDLPVAT
jgi:hypothetical protein